MSVLTSPLEIIVSAFMSARGRPSASVRLGVLRHDHIIHAGALAAIDADLFFSLPRVGSAQKESARAAEIVSTSAA